MNNKKQQNIQSEKTLTEIFKYNAGGEASEYHIIIHSTKPEDTYEEQLNAVLNTYDYLLTQELKGAVAILKRYFLSDAANQADTLLALTTEGSGCTLSIVEQPPLDGTKIALWVYLLTDVQTQVLHNGLFEVKHSAYRHFQSCRQFGIPDPPVIERLCDATHGARLQTGGQLYPHMVLCTKCRRELCRSSESA